MCRYPGWRFGIKLPGIGNPSAWARSRTRTLAGAMNMTPTRACGMRAVMSGDDLLVHTTSPVSSRVSSTASLCERGHSSGHGDSIATLLAAAEVLSSVHNAPAPVIQKQPPVPAVPVVVLPPPPLISPFQPPVLPPPPLISPFRPPVLPCAICSGSRADYWATVLGSGCPRHMRPMPVVPPVHIVNRVLTPPAPLPVKPPALSVPQSKPVPMSAQGLKGGVQKKASGRLKRHACDICGARFAQRGGVNSHVRTVHLKEKRFQCEFPGCSRVFGHRGDATRHVRSFHQKLRPFKCSTCGAGFARKSVLVRHRKNVHQES